MQAAVTGFYSNSGGCGAIFEDIYVVAGKRTPFGKMTGSLSTVSPTDLGIMSSRAALEAAQVNPRDIDQLIAANIGQASADSFFLPRHIALYSGLRLEAPAVMAQRICGSGIEIIGQAAEQIGLKKAASVLAVGTETMSRFPLASYSARQGFALGRPEFVDLLWEALGDTAAVPMGQTADILAKKYGVTREEVDRFAETSQNKYFAAESAGFYKGEIIPVAKSGAFEVANLKPRKYKLKDISKDSQGVEKDEHPRMTSLEKLKSLSPVFTTEGPTTAGNASGIVDGACSVVVASGDYVRSHGLKVLGKIRGFVSVGVEPQIMGIGPAPAIRSLLGSLDMQLNDIDLFEINEAFGAQCYSVAKDLELDLNKLNIHGGAIAIGHPLAATGTRLVTTLLRSLHLKKKSIGVASACIGGGQGIAMVVEAV
ncbi:MAG: acetyl-CoA acetyltransferase [Bdellovibrionales bacterium RBG_16_40_8]|nr:MAG: acetyl-CoA acetyltransferase [Bdellovibrionales bacterium RBG_16_40_8]